MKRTLKVVSGMALILTGVAVPVLAASVDIQAPEISVGMLGNALTLLSGGYLVVSSRLSRKQ